jgi:hypothetical protein
VCEMTKPETFLLSIAEPSTCYSFLGCEVGIVSAGDLNRFVIVVPDEQCLCVENASMKRQVVPRRDSETAGAPLISAFSRIYSLVQ